MKVISNREALKLIEKYKDIKKDYGNITPVESSLYRDGFEFKSISCKKRHRIMSREVKVLEIYGYSTFENGKYLVIGTTSYSGCYYGYCIKIEDDILDILKESLKKHMVERKEEEE